MDDDAMMFVNGDDTESMLRKKDKTIAAQSEQISKLGARIAELKEELAKAMGLLDILTEEDPTDRVQLLGKLGEQTTKLALMQVDRDKLRDALRYLADENNYDTCDECPEGGKAYQLIRPGGARQEGITTFSRHLYAWTYAAQFALSDGGEESGG